MQVPYLSHWQAQNHHISEYIRGRIGNVKSPVIDANRRRFHREIPKATDRIAAEDGSEEHAHSPCDDEGAYGICVHVKDSAEEYRSVVEEDRDLDEGQGDDVADILGINNLLDDQQTARVRPCLGAHTFRSFSTLPIETTSICFPNPSFTSAKNEQGLEAIPFAEAASSHDDAYPRHQDLTPAMRRGSQAQPDHLTPDIPLSTVFLIRRDQQT